MLRIIAPIESNLLVKAIISFSGSPWIENYKRKRKHYRGLATTDTPCKPITWIRPLSKGRAKPTREGLRVVFAILKVIGDHVPVIVNINDRGALRLHRLGGIITLAAGSRRGAEMEAGEVIVIIRIIIGARPRIHPGIAGGRVIIILDSDLIRIAAHSGVVHGEGGAGVIIAFTGHLLEPEHHAVTRRIGLGPFAVDPGVRSDVRIKGEELTSHLAVTGIRISIFGIPAVEGIARAGGGVGGRIRPPANGDKLGFGVTGVGQVLIENEPVALLRICLQGIVLLRQLKGSIADVMEHHFPADFGHELLPAHELGINAHLPGGVVLRHGVGGIGCLGSENVDLIDLDHDAQLVQIRDVIGLEHHGIVFQGVAILDAACLIKLCRHILANTGDGLAAVGVGGGVVGIGRPSLEDGSLGKGADAGIIDVLLDHAQLALVDHHGCDSVIRFMELHRQAGIRTLVRHYVDGEITGREGDGGAVVGNGTNLLQTVGTAVIYMNIAVIGKVAVGNGNCNRRVKVMEFLLAIGDGDVVSAQRRCSFGNARTNGNSHCRSAHRQAGKSHATASINRLSGLLSAFSRIVAFDGLRVITSLISLGSFCRRYQDQRHAGHGFPIQSERDLITHGQIRLTRRVRQDGTVQRIESQRLPILKLRKPLEHGSERNLGVVVQTLHRHSVKDDEPFPCVNLDTRNRRHVMGVLILAVGDSA